MLTERQKWALPGPGLSQLSQKLLKISSSNFACFHLDVWATFPANFIKFWDGRAGAICWIDTEWPFGKVMATNKVAPFFQSWCILHISAYTWTWLVDEQYVNVKTVISFRSQMVQCHSFGQQIPANECSVLRFRECHILCQLLGLHIFLVVILLLYNN